MSWIPSNYFIVTSLKRLESIIIYLCWGGFFFLPGTLKSFLSILGITRVSHLPAMAAPLTLNCSVCKTGDFHGLFIYVQRDLSFLALVSPTGNTEHGPISQIKKKICNWLSRIWRWPLTCVFEKSLDLWYSLSTGHKQNSCFDGLPLLIFNVQDVKNLSWLLQLSGNDIHLLKFEWFPHWELWNRIMGAARKHYNWVFCCCCCCLR